MNFYLIILSDRVHHFLIITSDLQMTGDPSLFIQEKIRTASLQIRTPLSQSMDSLLLSILSRSILIISSGVVLKWNVKIEMPMGVA